MAVKKKSSSYVPRNTDKHGYTPTTCPYDQASLFTKYVSFFWIVPLLKKGFKHGLVKDDLYNVPAEDQSHILGKQLRDEWGKELVLAAESNRNPSLFRVFVRQHCFWFLMSWLWLLVSHCVLSPLQALILGSIIDKSSNYYNIKLIQQQSSSSLNSTINTTSNNSVTNSMTSSLIDPAYLQQQLNEMYYEILYLGIFLIVITGIVFITIHPYFFCVQHLGTKLRIASCSMIFEKCLLLDKTALDKTDNGQIVNLLSNDVNRFDHALVFLPYLILAPLQTIIVVTLLSHFYLGWAPTLSGFSILLLYLPFQGFMGKLSSTIREKTAVRTDERIRLMNEIIPAMRVIKMYAWERPFAKLVDIARRDEVRWIRYKVILTSINESLYFVSAKLIILVTILVLVFTGKQLTAEAAFVTITMLDSLRLNMTFFFPFAISSSAELLVTCNRLRDFFLLVKPINTPKQKLALQNNASDSTKQNNTDNTDNKQVIAKNLCASWQPQILSNSSVASHLTNLNDPDNHFSLSAINFQVNSGELLVIVGRVGSGKSSILMTLLDEMPIISGSLQKPCRLSYASQDPWIFSGTLEENIYFYKDRDETRLNDVIKACALHKDIDLLPNGKETLVGERGISLSGGQKARVNLARALYADADIYLLDDPLSAVDTIVASHLFEHAIKGYLRDKVVILVTHQLQYTKSVAKILVVEQGRQVAYGSYKELSKQVDLVGFNKSTTFRLESESECGSKTDVSKVPGLKKSPRLGKDSSIASKGESSNADDDIPAEAPIRQMTDESKYDAANVSYDSYSYYLKCIGSVSLLVLIVVTNILAQALFNGTEFYLAYWTETEEKRSTSRLYFSSPSSPLPSSTSTPTELKVNISSIETNNSLALRHEIQRITSKIDNTTFTDSYTTIENGYIYSLMILLLFFATLIRTTAFFVACMRASVRVHAKLFKSIMEAPISFFDFNPIGALLNRISRDMGIVDDRLPQNAFDVFEIFTASLGSIATVVVVGPLNAIPAICLIFVALITRRMCLKTSNKVKEIEGVLRSQVFSHLSATLSGLVTLRAFKVEKEFISRFDTAQDSHSASWLIFVTSSQWLGLMLDMVCLGFILFVIIVLTATIDSLPISGSQVGLAISSALVIVGPFQWGIRQIVELESFMTSVNRIKEYSELPKEAHEPKNLLDKELRKPLASWPERGEIVYDDVSLRYFENEEKVLHNVSFRIAPREKIGVVGRTGAGKSSLIAALFRMTEPTGRIIIDLIDTKTINLTDLRRSISIIPQEPILFSSTVRRNLDPFEEYDDSSIWRALKACQLEQTILNFEDRLEARVSEGGLNFSVGQRQLICLARSILRRNKILVLDEATANVDQETDEFIQRTIRKQFSTCTVITIAHRLETIMDSDRVLVLDNGRVCEFDEPYVLLTKSPSGHFASMAAQTGAQSTRLRQIAERAHNRRQQV